MRKEIKGSVIIPTYNRATLLKLTLDSLVLQSHVKDQFEVLVCDDGSTDETKEVCKSYHSLLNLRYLYQEDEGYRVAKARNMGIEAAAGEICIFLDSGMLVNRGYVFQHIVSYLGSERRAMIGDVFGYDANHSGCQQLIEIIGWEEECGRPSDDSCFQSDLRSTFFRETNFNENLVPAPWLVYWTGNASARTSDVRSVGMFDESLVGWGGEDIDLAYRLYHDGVRIYSTSKAKALHLPHPSNKEQKLDELGRNNLLLWKKHNEPIFKYVLRYGYRAINMALMRGERLEEAFSFDENFKAKEFC